MLNSKTKLTILIIILAVVAFILLRPKQENETYQPSPTPVTQVQQNDSPRIVSTKPEPLENAIISASDVIEITFNRPLENVGEFKLRIEPKVDVKVELSSDRKTAKIIPVKPYELGAGYTIFIGPDSKFDGVGEWRQDSSFHFRTIRYRGV